MSRVSRFLSSLAMSVFWTLVVAGTGYSVYKYFNPDPVYPQLIVCKLNGVTTLVAENAYNAYIWGDVLFFRLNEQSYSYVLSPKELCVTSSWRR